MVLAAKLTPILWPIYQQSADIRQFVELGYSLKVCRMLSRHWRKHPPSEPSVTVFAWWMLLRRVARSGRSEDMDYTTWILAREELGVPPGRRAPPKRKPFSLKAHLALNQATPELREQARYQYSQGHQTFTQLLSRLNVSRRTLTDMLIGVKPPPLSLSRVREVQEAYRNGTSIKSLCRKFGLSLDETHRHLRPA